jgi:hypothetical protein
MNQQTIDVRIKGVWVNLGVPNPEKPFWHDTSDGERKNTCELLLDIIDVDRPKFIQAHVDAVADLIKTGIDAHLADEYTKARTILTAASRLATEPTGQWSAITEGVRR